MKFGRLNISLVKPSQKISEKYKSQYDKGSTTKPARKVYHQGENTWRSRCLHYDQLCEEQPLAKQGLLTLAGLCISQGVFTKPATDKEDETYALAEEAQYRVDKFNIDSHINTKFHETFFRMAKHGGCFWEVTETPVRSFRIAPMQECIEPYEADEKGAIIKWRQIVNGTVTAEWTDTELILVPGLMMNTHTWPWASSFLSGLETELEALVDMETSAKDYMSKQAWPYEVLSLGTSADPVSDEEYNQARNEWRNRKPGEGFTVSVPTAILPGGTGSAPIRDLAVLCELMKDNVQDGLMVPGISKLYNSTEASAKVLTSHVMSSLGQPLQWIVKEYYQEYILKPMLESSGFSRKSCPEITFESPDTNKKEEGEYWTSLVNAKIQSPVQAAEHLGLEYDEAYWKKQEQKEQDQMQQKLNAKAPFGAKPELKPEPKEEAKLQPEQVAEYDEWMVRKRKPSKLSK
jgi:hypothetical protein